MTSPTRLRPHHGWQKTRPPYTLKDATSDLIDACGGLKAAAEIMGLSVAQTGRYADPSFPRVHLTIDGLLRLAQASGDVGVLQYLADRLGYGLTRHDLNPLRSNVAAEMASAADRVAQMFQAHCAALTDLNSPGSIDPAEAAAISDAVLALQRQLATVTAQLQRLQEGDRA